MSKIESMMAEHPLLQGLAPDQIHTVAQGAAMATFEEDDFLFKAHESADHCYLLMEGAVALKIHAPVGPITIQTIGAGETLGWSWLFPPYKWHYDARAFQPTKAVALNATHLRRAFEDDAVLGYRMLARIAEIIAQRLQATQLQLLDVYDVRTRTNG